MQGATLSSIDVAGAFSIKTSGNFSKESFYQSKRRQNDKYLGLFLLYKKNKKDRRENYQRLVGMLIDDIVKTIARSMQMIGGSLAYEDLVQEGYFGIAKAIEKFDPGKGTLKNYAYIWARAAIRKAIDNQNGDIRIGNGVLNEKRKIARITNRLRAQDGTVDWNKVSRETGISEKTLEKKRWEEEVKYFYLSSPIGEEMEEGELWESYFPSGTVNQQDWLEEKNAKEMMSKVFGTLTQQEEKVLRLRFGITTERAIGLPKTKKGGKKKKTK